MRVDATAARSVLETSALIVGRTNSAVFDWRAAAAGVFWRVGARATHDMLTAKWRLLTMSMSLIIRNLHLKVLTDLSGGRDRLGAASERRTTGAAQNIMRRQPAHRHPSHYREVRDPNRVVNIDQIGYFPGAA